MLLLSAVRLFTFVHGAKTGPSDGSIFCTQECSMFNSMQWNCFTDCLDSYEERHRLETTNEPLETINESISVPPSPIVVNGECLLFPLPVVLRDVNHEQCLEIIENNPTVVWK